MSVRLFRSLALSRSGAAEDVLDALCALAIEDAARKSAAVPTTTIFDIGDLLG
jgi:hypothetical protein